MTLTLPATAAFHFLYVSAQGLIALRQTGSTLTVTGTFSSASLADATLSDAAGETAPQASFAALIHKYPRDRFVFFVDSVDEELQVEQIPRLRGRDLRRLIQRRLELRFRGSSYRSSMRLDPPSSRTGLRLLGMRLPGGREEVGADTRNILLLSLRDGSMLDGWLAIALFSQARIHSIQSPALLSHRIVAEREGGSSRTQSGLLVSVHPGGLRQTLILNGRPRFTRLASEAHPISASGAAAECSRTILYLLMEQLLDRAEFRASGFIVWIVTDGLSEAEQLPAELTVDSLVTVPVRRLSATLHVTPSPINADPLLGGPPPGSAALALWSRCAEQRSNLKRIGYATRSVRRHAINALWRTGILAIAASTLIASLAALVAVESVDGDSAPSLSAARASLQTDTVEYGRLTAALARFPAGGDVMRDMVQADRRLQRGRIDSDALFGAVADALRGREAVALDAIRWARGDFSEVSALSAASASAASTTTTAAAALADAGAPLAFGVAPASPNMIAGANTVGRSVGAANETAKAAQATDANEPPADKVPPISVQLTGHVDRVVSMAGANQEVERFAASLRRLCGCDVKVSSPPFETQPDKSVTADLKADGRLQAPGFTILMRWAPAPVGGGHVGAD